MRMTPNPRLDDIYPHGGELYPKPDHPHQPPRKGGRKPPNFFMVWTVIAIIAMWALVVMIYIPKLVPPPPPAYRPTGSWGSTYIVSATEVNVEFSKVVPEQRPVDLEIVLVRNETTEGMNRFSDNLDRVLNLTQGTNVGTLTYVDLTNNLKVNAGDMIEMTDLAPDSEYTLMMVWGPTGDVIDRTTFSTPA